MVNQIKSKLVFHGSNYFRQRIALSILSGKSIEITDIRTKSDKPGLQEYEINLLRLVDKLTDGMDLVINEVGTKIAFQPGLLIGGEIEHECCKQRGIGYYLELIFMLAPFFKKGVKITLRGVTNNEKDLSVDAFQYGAIPILRKFILVDDNLDIVMKKRAIEPSSKGEITFSCPAIKYLKPVQFMDYGKIKRIRGTVFSFEVSPSIPRHIVSKAKELFLNFIPDVYFIVDCSKEKRNAKNKSGFGACFVAESTTGVVLTSDVSTPKPNVSTHELDISTHKLDVSTLKLNAKIVPDDFAEKAAFLLLEEISRGGCVDSSFQSIVCLYMALQSKDLSQCLLGPLSPYTVQFLRHLKDFFDVTFKLEPQIEHDRGIEHAVNKVVVTCMGIGYCKLT